GISAHSRPFGRAATLRIAFIAGTSPRRARPGEGTESGSSRNAADYIVTAGRRATPAGARFTRQNNRRARPTRGTAPPLAGRGLQSLAARLGLTESARNATRMLRSAAPDREWISRISGRSAAW